MGNRISRVKSHPQAYRFMKKRSSKISCYSPFKSYVQLYVCVKSFCQPCHLNSFQCNDSLSAAFSGCQSSNQSHTVFICIMVFNLVFSLLSSGLFNLIVNLIILYICKQVLYLCYIPIPYILVFNPVSSWLESYSLIWVLAYVI